MSVDELLAVIDRYRDRLEEPGYDDAVLLTEAMEEVASRPGGLARLVERYADAPSAILTGNLAAVLADAAKPERPGTIAPLVWDAIARLANRDELTRNNLLTTLQYLHMRGELDADRDVPPLDAFLLECLDLGGALVDSVVDALVALHARCSLRGEPARLATLRERLLALGPEVADSLDNYFLDTGRIPFAIQDDAPSDELFAQLDALAQEPPAKPVYDRAWAIAQVLARRDEGLAQLVARYAASSSPVISRAVSLAVARAEIAPLAWDAIARSHTRDAPTLRNLLGAADRAVRDASVPATLAPFLRAALDHPDPAVANDAVRVVSALDAYDALPEDIAPLRAQVVALRTRAPAADAWRYAFLDY